MARQAVSLERKPVQSGGKVYAYWVLRWHDPETGKKRSESLGRADDRRAKNYITQREARTIARQREADFHVRPRRRSAGLTLPEWVGVYAKQREAEGVSPATRKIDDYVGRLLVAYFGDVALREIERADARGWWTALTAGELAGVSTSLRGRRKAEDGTLSPAPPPSAQTAGKLLRNARAMFNRAVDDEVIEANPFARVRPVKQTPAAWRQVTLGEFRQLLRVVPGEWKKLVALARLASLTRDDALDLTWSQVNLAQSGREIRITRNKSGVEQRVPLNDELLRLLRQWHAERAAINIRGDFVVDRSRVYLHNIGRDFRAWCERAGVEPYAKPLHDLRKSCISDWVRIQPAANVVKLWAGHATIKTTLDYYDQAREADMAVGRGGRSRTGLRRPPNRAPTKGRRRVV